VPQNKQFESIIEVGCGTGFLTKQIIEILKPHHLFINDLSSRMISTTVENICKTGFTHFTLLPGDAETINFAREVDAVITSSTLQWFNNLEVFVHKVANSLKHNGIFAFSTFGSKNFEQIKSLTGKGLKYPSINQLISLLTPHFDVLDVRESEIIEWFSEPCEAMRHIKNTGVNALATKCMKSAEFKDFLQKYQDLYANNKAEVPLTYHPLWFVCRKKIPGCT
jgi:malonyl-CoA O-methyltransferase